MAPTHIKEKAQYHYDGKLRIPMELHQQIKPHIGKGKAFEFLSDFMISAIQDKLYKIKRGTKQ